MRLITDKAALDSLEPSSSEENLGRDPPMGSRMTLLIIELIFMLLECSGWALESDV